VVSPTQITGTFDLTDKFAGPYNVVVTNSGDSGFGATTYPDGFSVTAPPAPASTPIISCPYVISDPGVYELLTDCTNSGHEDLWYGITIASPDVVFDGMGHTINGLMPPAGGKPGIKGIYANGPTSNVIVKNVTVTRTYNGITYDRVDNGRIDNITARNNVETNIFLKTSSGNTVTNCTATGLATVGVGVWDGSNSNTILNNTVNYNNRGFSLYDAQNNVIADNTIENNNIGVQLISSDDTLPGLRNQIFHNTVHGNTGFGIQLESPGPQSVYDNYLSNDANTNFVGSDLQMEWDGSGPGPNIIGGPIHGGNYWATPAGTGFSQTCADTDDNGICDSAYTISTGNIDYFPLTALTTPNDAGHAVTGTYPVDLSKQTMWLGNSVLPASFEVITSGVHSKHTMPDYAGYVAFIDDNPNAQWDHAARLVYVEDTKVNPRTAEFKVSSRLANVDLSYNGGMLADPTGDVTTPPPGAPACVNPDYSHYYALLISGGIQKEANYVRYRNDIAFMYQTLTQKYGYPKDHIIVLMSDGNDPGLDQLTGYDGNNNPVFANSKTDFDYAPDGISDVKDVPATRTNVLQTLDDLRSKLTKDDNLFIFTTTHGANMHTGEPNDLFTGDVILYLWGTGEEGWISDADFVNALPGSPLYPTAEAKSITMVMEQCFGGGFADNFIDTAPPTQKRVIATAADYNEYSWGNAYSFQWINGEWFNPWSMEDAHVNARQNDRYYTTYLLEHPKFFSSPDQDTGTSLYLADCSGTPPTPLITVTEPGADTWYTGQTHDIKWTQSGLSGTMVNIELWKGSSTTRTLAIVPSPVDATKGTQSWTIPTTLAAGRDYWIKISETQTGVSGRSEGSLTINRGRGASTGTLWVNSTPVSGAMIYIDGVLQKGANGANILTNASFTLSAGSHDVGVELDQYYAVPVSNINVPLAGTTSLNFQLTPIINSDCKPYGIMDISSMPVQDAKITIRDQGTGKEIKGLFTNTITQIAPGTYTVTVEHDGYQTATLSGVYIAKPLCGVVRAANVRFDLVPAEDVHAIVKIVPRSLNLKSNGYFMAFVTLPSGYKAADVIPGSVVCEGATALKLIRHKLFPRTFVAIFRRSDLVEVPTGNSVPMTVEGSIKQTNGNPGFSGTDKIKVISTKSNKEEYDDSDKWSDDKIFRYNPGYTKDDEKVFSQSKQKDDKNDKKDNGKR
jgi:parallel beta-helix repeat protein